MDRLDRQPDLCAKSKLLVALGDSFARTSSAIIRPSDKAKKVPGCVSEVYVAVSLSYPQGGSDASVSIRGTSDARVSRGILALLAQGLEGESTDKVLGLRREVVARAVGLGAGLADSRINGLGNMLQTIQAQVRDHLDGTLPDRTAPAAERDHGRANLSPLRSRASPVEDATVAPRASEWSPGPGAKDEVAVLLSGGVDSSVALRLVQDQGYRVRAFYLKIWLEDELAHLGECPWVSGTTNTVKIHL